jgi:hypothetical protein
MVAWAPSLGLSTDQGAEHLEISNVRMVGAEIQSSTARSEGVYIESSELDVTYAYAWLFAWPRAWRCHGHGNLPPLSQAKGRGVIQKAKYCPNGTNLTSDRQQQVLLIK